MMKTTLKSITIAVLLAVVAVCPALAGDSTFGRYWSSFNTGDATGAGATYLAFGGTTRMTGMIPRINTANVTGDAAGSVLTILAENGDSTTMDAAYSAGGQVLPVTATTSFQADVAGAGSWIAILDRVNEKFEVNRVSSITAGASLNLVRATVNAYASGSSVYELTSLGTMVVGNATKDWNPTQILGLPGKVLGFAVNGTSAASINYIAGDYVPQ